MLNSVPVPAHAGPADHEPFQVETEEASIAARSKFLGADGVVDFDVDNHAALGVHDSALSAESGRHGSSRHDGRVALRVARCER